MHNFTGQGCEAVIKEARATFQHHSAKRSPSEDVIVRHKSRKILEDFNQVRRRKYVRKGQAA